LALETVSEHVVAVQTGGGWGQTGVRVNAVPVAEHVPVAAAGGSEITIAHCWDAPSTTRESAYVSALHALPGD
jgi:hypothetical protein